MIIKHFFSANGEKIIIRVWGIKIVILSVIKKWKFATLLGSWEKRDQTNQI